MRAFPSLIVANGALIVLCAHTIIAHPGVYLNKEPLGAGSYHAAVVDNYPVAFKSRPDVTYAELTLAPCDPLLGDYQHQFGSVEFGSVSNMRTILCGCKNDPRQPDGASETGSIPLELPLPVPVIDPSFLSANNSYATHAHAHGANVNPN